jgi:hypothetical protein
MNRLEQKSAIMATTLGSRLPNLIGCERKMIFIMTALLLVALHYFCSSKKVSNLIISSAIARFILLSSVVHQDYNLIFLEKASALQDELAAQEVEVRACKLAFAANSILAAIQATRTNNFGNTVGSKSRKSTRIHIADGIRNRSCQIVFIET